MVFVQLPAKRSSLTVPEAGELIHYCMRGNVQKIPPARIFEKILSVELARVVPGSGDGLDRLLSEGDSLIHEKTKSAFEKSLIDAKRGIFREALLPILLKHPEKQKAVSFKFVEKQTPGQDNSYSVNIRYERALECLSLDGRPTEGLGKEFFENMYCLFNQYALRSRDTPGDIIAPENRSKMADHYISEFVGVVLDRWLFNIRKSKSKKIREKASIHDAYHFASEEDDERFAILASKFLKENAESIILSLSSAIEAAIRKIALSSPKQAQARETASF